MPQAEEGAADREGNPIHLSAVARSVRAQEAREYPALCAVSDSAPEKLGPERVPPGWKVRSQFPASCWPPGRAVLWWECEAFPSWCECSRGTWEAPRPRPGEHSHQDGSASH